MNSIAFAALRLLANGEFHSGEAMAHKLGVSRASVWQALRGIEQGGIRLYKVRGRGYCLPEPVRWLDRKAILAALGRDAKEFSIEVLDQAESTSTALMERAAAGAPSGSIVVAELQTHGRGRRGRPWHTGLGGALTFSLLWRFEQGAGVLGGLSLAVGLAVLRALEEMEARGAQLKWPNDIVFQYHKLGGILIELQGDALGPSSAVIGVGLNTRLSDAVKSRIDQAVTDIHSISGAAPDRNLLLARVLIRLRAMLEEFQKHGFAPFKSEWVKHHAYHNKPVTISLPGGARRSGIVRGVANDGALLLETSEGRQHLNVGEISLRGAP